MNKALSVLSTAVVGAGAVVAVVATAPAANAATGDLPSGYYAVPYSPAILQWDEPSEKLTLLTYDEWQAAGFPAPLPTSDETLYGRYPWSPGIVGATFFTSQQSATPVFYYEGLTPASWARAGYPNPEVVSDTVLPGSAVISYSSSPEVFIGDATDTVHKLSYGEWSTLGSPSPTSVGSVQKYSFDSTLYLYLDAADSGQPATIVALTGTQWNALANPSPATPATNRLPGDAVFAFTDDPGDIYLRTPTKQVEHLDLAEWQSMNSPTPVLVTPPSTDATPSAVPSTTAGRASDTHRKDVQVVRRALGLS